MDFGPFWVNTVRYGKWTGISEIDVDNLKSCNNAL
jgi:hypothetical protein